MPKGKSNILPKEIRLARRRKFRRKILIFFFIFVFLVAGVALFSNSKLMRIENIEVSGAEVLNPEEIKDFIKKEMDGKVLFIFSKKNYIFLPVGVMERSVTKEFPRIGDIHGVKTNQSTISFSITEREEEYLWCGDSPVFGASLADKECYFLDKTGFIFAKAPLFSGSIYFRFFNSLESPEPIGNYVFDSEEFAKLIYFVGLVNEIGLPPVSLSFENEDGSSPNYVIYFKKDYKERSVPPKIILKKDFDPEKIANNLNSIFSLPEFLEKFESESGIEYIDLRFDGKVYYK